MGEIVVIPLHLVEPDPPHPADRKAMQHIAARLGAVAANDRTDFADHVADVLVTLSDIVAGKENGEVPLGHWADNLDHVCADHTKAALYLLAHCFEHTPGEPSRVLAWAVRVVDHLLDEG